MRVRDTENRTAGSGGAADAGAISLVVPVFNEAERVLESLERLVKFVGIRGSGSELIFVDDGSADRTVEVLEQAFAGFEGVDTQVVRRPHLGKGAAVRAGLASARAPVAAFCDVDLSTPLWDLARIIDTASRSHGLVIGSRAAEGASLVRRQHPIREGLGRAYNRLLRSTLINDVHDTQCGAKAAPLEVWRSLLAFSRECGFAWDVEIVAIAQHLGVEVDEVPVSWADDRRSRVRLLRDGAELTLAVPRISRHVRSIGVQSQPLSVTPGSIS